MCLLKLVVVLGSRVDVYVVVRFGGEVCHLQFYSGLLNLKPINYGETFTFCAKMDVWSFLHNRGGYVNLCKYK